MAQRARAADGTQRGRVTPRRRRQAQPGVGGQGGGDEDGEGGGGEGVLAVRLVWWEREGTKR